MKYAQVVKCGNCGATVYIDDTLVAGKPLDAWNNPTIIDFCGACDSFRVHELMKMIDKLTDDGNHPEERTRFGEIVHEVYGSWENFEKTA